MVQINYALQVCDLNNRENRPRLISTDRSLISKKSICSFFESLEIAASRRRDVQHTVLLITDQCSQDLKHFCELVVDTYETNNISVSIQDLSPRTGITHSIRACYEWLSQCQGDLVFQIQDDYLFEPTALTESINVWYKIYKDTQHHAIIQPFNDWHNWTRGLYTPHALTMILGSHRYWIQIYDTSCSFMTSHHQFVQHWDLYNDFFDLIDARGPDLENRSLNYMFTQRGILGITPTTTLSHHLQHLHDLYVPPDQRWESVDVARVYQSKLALF